jgi:hypothetical protein
MADEIDRLPARDHDPVPLRLNSRPPDGGAAGAVLVQE